MTNDSRRALEDAIISYGVAKVLHATSEPEMRELVENALCEAWERIMDAIDVLDREHDAERWTPQISVDEAGNETIHEMGQ